MAVVAALVVAAPASGGERVARNGAIVPMPPIEALDCPGMAGVIARIDASNYRDPDAPDLTPEHPDWPIFEYENQVTAREYFECTLSQSRDTDPGVAFEKK